MTEQITANGRCLCGAVGVRAQIKPSVGACHCGMCRKLSSGPLFAIEASGSVDFTGEAKIKKYRSSQWAERGFCTECGSSLFYRLLPREGLPEGQYILSAGFIDDATELKFDHEVFVDQAPGFYQLADTESRQCMTEAEVFAGYS